MLVSCVDIRSLWLNNKDKFIWWLFDHRCVGIDEPCGNLGADISHIYPRSRGKISSMNKNKVIHCRGCHDEYHRRGVNDIAIEKLQARREEYLRSIGREDYI